MKKLSKKVIAFALAVVMTLTAGAVAPQGNVEARERCKYFHKYNQHYGLQQSKRDQKIKEQQQKY